MDKNIQDVAFLCGIQYLEKYKIINERNSAFYDMLNDDTNFLRRLKYFIYELSSNVDSDMLTDMLCLPKFFIRMMNPEKYRNGFCVICDSHQSQIHSHLKLTHRFPNATLNEYKKMFSNSCYYPMVTEKTLEENSGKKRKKLIKAVCNEQEEISESYRPCKVSLTCADCSKAVIHICSKNKSSITPCDSSD